MLGTLPAATVLGRGHHRKDDFPRQGQEVKRLGAEIRNQSLAECKRGQCTCYHTHRRAGFCAGAPCKFKPGRLALLLLVTTASAARGLPASKSSFRGAALASTQNINSKGHSSHFYHTNETGRCLAQHCHPSNVYLIQGIVLFSRAIQSRLTVIKISCLL